MVKSIQKKGNTSTSISANFLHRSERKFPPQTSDRFLISDFWDSRILTLFKQQFSKLYHKSLDISNLLEIKDLLLEYHELTEYYLDIFEDVDMIRPILGHIYLKRAATALMVIDRMSRKLKRDPNSIQKWIYSCLRSLEDIKLLLVHPLIEYTKNGKMRNVQCFIIPEFTTDTDLENVVEWYRSKGRIFGFNKPPPTKNKDKDKTKNENQPEAVVSECANPWCKLLTNVNENPKCASCR